MRGCGLRPEVGHRRSATNSAMKLNSAKDLDVYKKSYELAMRVFEASRRFPVEERFALMSQIRRSSRGMNPRP